jgi:uncharacterized membrane protein
MHPYIKAATSRLETWLDWLHRRWPLLGLVVLLLLAVIAVIYQEALAAAIHFAWEHAAPATRTPVGVFGLLFIVMIFGLILMGFVETSPVIQSIGRRAPRRGPTESELQELSSRVNLLESRVEAEVELRNQWYEKYTFGRQLQQMPPIHPHDRAFMLGLAGDVEEEMRKAVRAAEAVLGELRAIALEEENEGATALIEQIGELQGNRLTSALNHLRWRLDPENREADRDPRAYLLVSYMLYAEWWMRFTPVARALNRAMERLKNYPGWYSAHVAFQERFWGAVRKDQLAALGAPADFYNTKAAVPSLTPPPLE